MGSRLSMSVGGQTTQYVHEGRALKSVTLPDRTVVGYEYDGRQRRVARTRNGVVTARWVYDGQYRVVAEVDAAGAVITRFVYASEGHSPDAMVRNGVTYAYVKNHLGTVKLVVNAATGAVVQRVESDAWGNVLSDSNPGFQPFIFAGGMFDNDTRLTHFGFRDYDSSSGSWLSPEPLLQSPMYVRRMAQSGMSVPTYSYALNNPVRYVDPDGRTALTFYSSVGQLYVDPETPGLSPYTIGATSGGGKSATSCMNNQSCAGKADEGPIPEGYYELSTTELAQGGGPGYLLLLNALKGDWGSFRVPLRETQSYGTTPWHGWSSPRSNFSLHGGRKPGSWGCVDVGGGIWGDSSTERLVRDLMRDPDGYVPFSVVR
jgi:RHS repeat-associated protein